MTPNATTGACELALFAGGIVDAAEIGELRRAPAGEDDARLAQFLDAARRPQGADRLLGSADGAAAARPVDVEQAKLLVDLVGRDAERHQPVGVEIDAHHPVDAAGAAHLAHPMHREQQPRDVVVDQPGNLLLRHGLGGDCVVDDRRADAVDPGDHRFLDSTRQVGADLGDGVAQVVDGAVGVLAVLEFDGGDREAVADVRLDVVDVAEADHRVLDLAGDLGLHLRRRRAGLGHGDGDSRQVEIGTVIDAQLVEAHPAGR
jgi:hypothetical protein